VSFHQSSISSKWHYIKVAFHQSGISSKQHFIKAAFHKSGISLNAQESGILSNDFQCYVCLKSSISSNQHNPNSSKRHFIKAAFHQSGISPNAHIGWHFIK
jgi:hypothetical protein